MVIHSQRDAWVLLCKFLRGEGRRFTRLDIVKVDRYADRWRIYFNAEPVLYGSPDSYIVTTDGEILIPKDTK